MKTETIQEGVNRLEVIDDSGRILVKYLKDGEKLSLSFQDDDRTLKIFITNPITETKNMKTKNYLLDWDKVKDFEDFKKVFSTAVRLEIADTSTGFDDIKQFFKEKQ